MPGPRLDLGGGTAKFAVRIHIGHRPLVLDASAAMLARGLLRGRAFDPVLGDAARLPFPDGSIGAVTITEAFHHFAPHQDAVVAEAARVLGDDGVLLIEDIDPGRLLGRSIELFERALRMGSRFLEPAALAALVRRHFATVTHASSGRCTLLYEARGPRVT